ncbi:hypothetical protein Lesp02_68930 [Lentzea sp. NBRC 105346]|nr:hypothetical protein Lesp02_68930 [Lentzea sp. NBRC 105346]
MLWEDLPEGVRRAVEVHIGEITGIEPVTGGVNSAMTVTVDAEAGRFFCKVIAANGRMAWMHRNEREVHPYLPDIAPKLQWTVEQDGWLILGLEHITGRHPDLSPGSADIRPVIDAVHDLHAKLTPCPAKVASFAEHWRQLPVWQQLGTRALELAEGDTLLHTDVHPLNILLDTRVRVIDWAWARTGAPWVDDAFLATRLMIAGHSPTEAEDQVADVPDEFVVALAGVWEHLAHNDPRPHRRRLARIARGWAVSRNL